MGKYNEERLVRKVDENGKLREARTGRTFFSVTHTASHHLVSPLSPTIIQLSYI